MKRENNNISVVLSVRNASGIIERTLKSVRWADEIILVDNESSDDTVNFAKSYGAQVYTRQNNTMLNENKNFGFTKASCEWVLCLDGDEVVPEVLKNEIIQTIQSDTTTAGFWIPRKNIIFGRWIRHGIWWPDRQLRLFRRGLGKYPCVHIHEYISVDGPTKTIIEPYLHYNYETINQYLTKMTEIYTENESANLEASGYQPVWTDALRFPVSDFVKIYFAQKGYLDGIHGLILALLQSFYSFIVFAKLWEKRGFQADAISLTSIGSEFQRCDGELKYWFRTAKKDNATNKFETIFWKMLRKLGTMLHI